MAEVVEKIFVPDEGSRAELEALMRQVLTTFEDYVKLSNKISPETVLSINSVDDAGQLADVVTSNIFLKVEQKQEILNEFRSKLRLEKVLEVLLREIDILEIEKNINAKVRQQIDKTQKEYYLREQLKAIQSELGDKDGVSGEVEEYREKLKNGKFPEEVEKKVTDKTKLVSIAQMSNVLGTIYPVKEIISLAHSKGAIVIVDGAQSVPHMKVDVRDLDADFLVFSGHKMLGPMGIGVMYGKEELLDKMPPFLMGGAQSPAFYNYMSGEEFMLWTAGLFGMQGKAARMRSEELLQRLGLWEARRRSIGGYSGGMKQRLGIAQALVNRPKIVFLDEPVSALDPIGRHEILTLIDELRSETTVFMSTHVLGDVERVCDRVIIVREGQVAVEASMDELRQTYATPVFTVELDPHDRDLTAMMQALPYVSGVRREGAVYRVAASDTKAARSLLPRAILDAGATLVQYGAESPGLEDIFLKVVGAQ
jgi:ABC-type multidrug transport system ATPase subunit